MVPPSPPTPHPKPSFTQWGDGDTPHDFLPFFKMLSEHPVKNFYIAHVHILNSIKREMKFSI